MPTYKLLYFNGRGAAEPARYLFALAGQEYTDQRVDGKEEWPKLKPSSIWGKLPQMTIDDDQPICQSRTICTVLGKHFGLMGLSQKDEIYIDMLMGCMDDVIQPLMKIFFEKDEAIKAELKKDYEEKYPDMLRRLEGFLCNNKGGDGWFVGDSITVADCYLHSKLVYIPNICPTCFDKFPKLSSFMKRFEANEKIAAWIAKRPKTDF